MKKTLLQVLGLYVFLNFKYLYFFKIDPNFRRLFHFSDKKIVKILPLIFSKQNYTHNAKCFNSSSWCYQSHKKCYPIVFGAENELILYH